MKCPDSIRELDDLEKRVLSVCHVELENQIKARKENGTAANEKEAMEQIANEIDVTLSKIKHIVYRGRLKNVRVPNGTQQENQEFMEMKHISDLLRRSIKSAKRIKIDESDRIHVISLLTQTKNIISKYRKEDNHGSRSNKRGKN